MTENMNNLVGPLISTTDADATVANQAVTYQITDPDPGNWFDIAADVSYTHALPDAVYTHHVCSLKVCRLNYKANVHCILQNGKLTLSSYFPQGTLSIRSEQVVDREHTGVLTDSQGNGVVSFTIEAVNAGTSGTLTSVQDAQV